MNINNLGLLNMFSTIINGDEHDSDYAITNYILNNIDNLSAISINEVVEEAFVSRSSVRRFCNRLGYNNFSELKNSLTDIIFPSNIHLREFEDIKSYRKELIEGLSNMIRDVNRMVTDNIIEYLVEKINKYEDILLISANNTSSNLVKFQQELFYAKKVVRLINNNFDSKFLKKVSRQSSLIFVVSVSGVFANAINDSISEMPGKKILISASRDEKLIESYDQVIYISKNDVREDNYGLLGKYGMTYFFDLISEEYIYKYKDNI